MKKIRKKKSHCLNILEDSQKLLKLKYQEYALVSFGFGKAGTQIISQILKEGLNVDINPLIPGKKVMEYMVFAL